MSAKLAAAAVFAGVAVLLTWPAAISLDTHIPGRAADDNVNFLWNLWWMRHGLATGADLFHTNMLFHPFGADLVLHTHSAVSAFVGATLLSRLSVPEAQNLILIIATALNGFCAYLLAARVTRSQSAAIVGGLYFAACPYFAGHLLGHFNLVPAWGLPLGALLFLNALERRQTLAALAAGIVVSAIVYTDYYYVVYFGAFVMILIASRWITISVRKPDPTSTRPRKAGQIDLFLLVILLVLLGVVIWIAVSGGGVLSIRGAEISMRSGFNVRIAAWLLVIVLIWRRWRPALRVARAPTATMSTDLWFLSVALGTALVFSSPLWLRAVTTWQSGDYRAPVPLWRSSTEGIDVVSLVAGPPFHPLWRQTGEWIYATFQMSTIESTAWLGLAAPFLLWIQRRHLVHQRGLVLWFAVASMFFLWALGPYLRVAGVNTGLMLPETLLHYIPIVSNARIPGRAMVMVYLALSVLVAAAVVSMPSHRRRGIAALVGLIIVAEFMSSPVPQYRLDRPAIYDELARLPHGAVWELPFGISDGFGERGALDNATLFYQSIHQKPLVGGFVARMPIRLEKLHDETPALRAMLELSEGRTLSLGQVAAAREDVLTFMETHGIRYIVVTTATPDQLRTFVETLPLRLVSELEGRRLLARLP